jgi:hypothetical protein
LNIEIVEQGSLGAGKADDTQTRQPLHIVLPPEGCAVVGGPDRTSVDQPAYDEAFDPTGKLAIPVTPQRLSNQRDDVGGPGNTHAEQLHADFVVAMTARIGHSCGVID